MDPQAALYDALDALRDGDRDSSVDCLEALAEWIKKGGFLPQVHERQLGGVFPETHLIVGRKRI